jgi:hypothetical protein
MPAPHFKDMHANRSRSDASPRDRDRVHGSIHGNVRLRSRPLRNRWAALLCLLAWFSATPSLVVASVAGIGMLDGQHRVRLAWQGAKVKVIFHHESDPSATAHHHSLLTNAIAAFAESSSSGPDHIFSFSEAGPNVATASTVLPAVASEVLAPALVSFVTPPLTPRHPGSPAFPRPPPDRAIALICLRSTTLRI